MERDFTARMAEIRELLLSSRDLRQADVEKRMHREHDLAERQVESEHLFLLDAKVRVPLAAMFSMTKAPRIPAKDYSWVPLALAHCQARTPLEYLLMSYPHFVFMSFGFRDLLTPVADRIDDAVVTARLMRRLLGAGLLISVPRELSSDEKHEIVDSIVSLATDESGLGVEIAAELVDLKLLPVPSDSILGTLSQLYLEECRASGE